MMKFLSKTMVWVLPVLAFAPLFAFSAGLVPCDGPDCNIGSFVSAISNGIDWVIKIAGSIAALAFAWAGVKYLTAGGDPSKIKQSHQIFWSVIVGFVIIMAAWLIVKFILVQMGVGKEFIRLG